jgi:hypothetical protein
VRKITPSDKRRGPGTGDEELAAGTDTAKLKNQTCFVAGR